MKNLNPTRSVCLRAKHSISALGAWLLLVQAWGLAFVHAADEPPSRMSFQSYLADDNGDPVGVGTPVNKKMIFTLFDAETGGTEQWADEQIVTVNNGYFSVILGEGSQVGGFNHDLPTAFSAGDSSVSDRYLQITVSETDGSNSEIITPRMRMLPSAYAFMSTFAKTAGSLSTPLPTASLQDQAVTGVKIATGAVDSSKIADGTITAVDIANSSVHSGTIVDFTIESWDIKNGAVNSAKIADGSIALADLGSNSVGTAKIINGAILTEDIADGAVTKDKIQTGLFQYRSYSANLTSTSGYVSTAYPVANWYPVLMGFNFGTVDIDENGDKPAWAVGINNGQTNWRFYVQGPTHNGRHIDITIHVMWIPSSLVSTE